MAVKAKQSAGAADGRPGGAAFPSRWPSRRLVVLALVTVLATVVVVALLGLWRASRAGQSGKAQLVQAERDLLAARFPQARQDLLTAERYFAAMNADLHNGLFGPALGVWRAVPLVRIQVRAVDTIADVGVSLSRAGLTMTDAAATIERPTGQAVALSGSLSKLRTAEASLRDGLTVLDHARAEISGLNQYRLLGPIAGAHREALSRITRIDNMAHTAEQGVSALIAFTGGQGGRRYIVLSQNPDELRPTGGFMGSYGVLTADDGQVRLGRYDDSVAWVNSHLSAVVPAAQLQSPFRFYDPPLDETLANVNAIPDWPADAQVALKLWAQGGETPADGVVSFTPQFLALVLAVTGPVSIPSYNETVTAGNVVTKLDFYTHGAGAPATGNHKLFLSPLGEAVMTKLLSAPSAQWRGLGTAIAKAFSARELLVWSRDAAVESTLVDRGWTGVLPATAGDFFYDSEFEYGAKNGRGLERTFAHEVALHADGSARITTTVTVDNTEGPGPNNDNVLTYYTLYGPPGATLNADASDPPFSDEPALSGHPAAGWFRTVPASSTGAIKVVWDVPDLAQQRSDGSWQYSLRWLHIVDNTNDRLHLKVDLPPKGRWEAAAPPSQVGLDHDVTGTWVYRISP